MNSVDGKKTVIRIIPEHDALVVTFTDCPPDGDTAAEAPAYALRIDHAAAWEIVDDVVGILQQSTARRGLWLRLKKAVMGV